VRRGGGGADPRLRRGDVGVRRVIGDGKASLEDDNGDGSVHVFDGGEALAVQAGAEGDDHVAKGHDPRILRQGVQHGLAAHLGGGGESGEEEESANLEHPCRVACP
jgi:hypothetical protein